MEEEFKECNMCAEKPGMPNLCESCLHNRRTVQKLKDEKHKLEKTLKIIKEIIVLQGIY